MDKVIGLDFGTLSARAVIVSCEDGSVLGEYVFRYPHGVITKELSCGVPLGENTALADASDYRVALFECVRRAMELSGADKKEIIGIGIAATTYTMVPCLEDFTALNELKEFSREPMAYIKLWKHRGAEAQAQKIQRLYNERGFFSVLEHYGGSANCEWALPKLLETYESAPNIFEKADHFCDLGEWLAELLVGERVTSLYTAGFKCMWTPECGYPRQSELETLAPGFAKAFREKFAGVVKEYDSPCGFLSEEAAKKAGLLPGIPVATPMGDGSLPGVYFCADNPDTLAVTVGTSIAMAFTSKACRAIRGINGVVYGGIVPGYWSYDAGQPCAGDMLSWFENTMLPETYTLEAKQRGVSSFDILNIGAAEEPWKNELTVLDWWNGNRSILNDMSLRGAICGFRLNTSTEDIYCAMIQGLACSLRKITEHLSDNGLSFERIVLCGGIPHKNALLSGQFADILGRPVYISQQRQVTAVAAGMLGAIAAGTSVHDTVTKMASGGFCRVEPDGSHRREYDEIYRRWSFYHDLLSRHDTFSK